MLIVQFIFGLIIGSFLSVCIYRIPFGRVESDESSGPPPDESKSAASSDKKAISINYPTRSFCPQCQHQLLWWHNIPLMSWILLRGKCAFCKSPISARYPVVELLTGIISVLSFQNFGINPTGIVIFAFCCALIVISFIDYDYYIIPNVISLPGFALGMVLAAVNQVWHVFNPPLVSGLMDAVWGVLAGGGFLFVISEVYLRLRKKEGLGMGDVKLLAMTGAFFGVSGSLYTIFIGSLLGSVLGITLVLVSRRKFSQQLPFGPYLALGTLIYIFVGNQLILRILEGLVRTN